MQIQGTITGWTPDFYEMPTYNGEPSDFRLKLLVPDAVDVVEELSSDASIVRSRN